MITKEQEMTKEQITTTVKNYSLFSWSFNQVLNPIAIDRAEGLFIRFRRQKSSIFL
jgi:hypothetical protein